MGKIFTGCLIILLAWGIIETVKVGKYKRETYHLKVLLSEQNETDIYVGRVIAFYKHYCGLKFPNKYVSDIEHLKKVRNLIIKYEYINEDIKTYYNLNNFIFAWCHNETGLNPELFNKNKDGSLDRYITQINSRTEPELVKVWDKYCKSDIDKVKQDKIEYGLVLIRIWINERARKGKSWAILSEQESRGWSMYWWLENVQKNN